MRWHSLLFFFLLAGPLVAADPAAPPATPTPSAADGTAKNLAKEPSVPGNDFDIPVPQGIPAHGIKIPHYDDKGNLVMVLEAEVANRTDDQHIEMENLRIAASDEEGKKIHIALPRSIFNLESRILTGNAGALIRREDFEITGDAMEFNTRTRYGIVRGNIKMTILTPNNQP